jgi:hypothetical protein
MSRPTIKIHNATTNEVVEREMNDEEFAQHQLDKANYEKNEELKAKAEAAKAAQRQALLDKLGITEEEARLLLGGN